MRHIYIDNIQCYSRVDTVTVIEHTKNIFLGLKNLCVILFYIKDAILFMTLIILVFHTSDLSIKEPSSKFKLKQCIMVGFVCLFCD